MFLQVSATTGQHQKAQPTLRNSFIHAAVQTQAVITVSIYKSLKTKQLMQLKQVVNIKSNLYKVI
jgi:hypothetical protein